MFLNFSYKKIPHPSGSGIYMICFLFNVSVSLSLDTYQLPLYFVAKVKVKKEVICISK